MANKAAGKGYENDNHYTDIKFQFLGIENIHVMRASLQKLLDGTSLSPCVSSVWGTTTWSTFLVYIITEITEIGNSAISMFCC